MPANTLRQECFSQLGRYLESVKPKNGDEAEDVTAVFQELPMTLLKEFAENQLTDLTTLLENRFMAFCVVSILIKVGKY